MPNLLNSDFPAETEGDKKKAKRIADRQANVLKLYEANTTQSEIARQLNVSLSTIRRDSRELKLTR